MAGLCLSRSERLIQRRFQILEWAQRFEIGSREVGDGCPTYVIAEIGSNHNQKIDQAIELIDAAAENGADAVKFQSLRLDQVHVADRVSEDFKQFFGQIELSENWYQKLLNHSSKRGVAFISSPTYYRAVQLLADLPASALKIASAQFGIHPWLVAQTAATGLPIIASTGLVTFDEVAQQMDVLAQTGNKKLVLLHCVSQYPTPVERVNLRMMNRYRHAFGCLVGFSDHTMSIRLPAIAVGCGACVIEKHITLDRGLPGPDHHFAMLPDEFREIVDEIREVEVALGSTCKAEFSEEENHFRETFIYKCVTSFDLEPGEALGDLETEARRAEGGIDVRLVNLLRREFVAGRPITAGTLLGWDDLRHVG